MAALPDRDIVAVTYGRWISEVTDAETPASTFCAYQQVQCGSYAINALKRRYLNACSCHPPAKCLATWQRGRCSPGEKGSTACIILTTPLRLTRDATVLTVKYHIGKKWEGNPLVAMNGGTLTFRCTDCYLATAEEIISASIRRGRLHTEAYRMLSTCFKPWDIPMANNPLTALNCWNDDGHVGVQLLKAQTY